MKLKNFAILNKIEIKFDLIDTLNLKGTQIFWKLLLKSSKKMQFNIVIKNLL